MMLGAVLSGFWCWSRTSSSLKPVRSMRLPGVVQLVTQPGAGPSAGEEPGEVYHHISPGDPEKDPEHSGGTRFRTSEFHWRTRLGPGKNTEVDKPDKQKKMDGWIENPDYSHDDSDWLLLVSCSFPSGCGTAKAHAGAMLLFCEVTFKVD